MENNSNSSTQSSTSAQTNSNTNTGGSQSGEKGNGFNMDTITDMLGGVKIPEALKKYSGTATKAISGLSTTQKVIGGALLLLGATYLSRRSRGGFMGKMGSVLNNAKTGKNKNNR